jgi:hypothetical protein
MVERYVAFRILCKFGANSRSLGRADKGCFVRGGSWGSTGRNMREQCVCVSNVKMSDGEWGKR